VALPGGSQSDVVGNGVDVSYATARLSLARRMSQRIASSSPGRLCGKRGGFSVPLDGLTAIVF